MIRRRDLIMAGLAVSAAGVAEALRPRKKQILLKGGKIDALVPKAFDNWTAEGSTGLVSPDQAGKLAKTLYSEIVERIYHDEKTGASIMVLAAYGDTQSDLLQLHRPEICYPAVGYTLVSTRPKSLPLSGGAHLPVREVVATAEGHTENIVYWTRIGEYLPQSGSEQRNVRLKNALHGYVSDGILFRCSTVGDSVTSFQLLETFIPRLLAVTQRVGLPALVGTQISGQMKA